MICRKGDKHPKEIVSPNLFQKHRTITCLGPPILFTESLGQISLNISHTTNLLQISTQQQTYLNKSLQLSLIKFLVCLTFQFATVTRIIHLEIRMSGDPPTQFDGLYKIAQVFGPILELNEPPTQFPLSGNMTTFLGIMLLIARK